MADIKMFLVGAKVEGVNEDSESTMSAIVVAMSQIGK